MKRRLLFTGAAAAAVTLLVPVAAASGSQLAQSSGGAVGGAGVVSRQVTTSAGARDSAVRYWTPQRMESAIPADRFEAKTAARAQAQPAKPTGAAMKIAGAKPTRTTLTTVGRNGSVVPLAGGFEWTGAQFQPPASTTGKVFFTSGGANFVCSGSAVSSENLDLVVTAGHCVHSGPGGAFHTNWIFVPNYRDGTAPLGVWSARELWTNSGWVNAGDPAFDVGMALTFPINGQHLVNVVGGQGFAWNQPRGQNVFGFGYPAAPPYNGERLIFCNGATFNDPNFFPPTLGISCDVTGGASGGPWLMAFDGTFGFENSVNSYKYNNDPFSIYGPYFDDNSVGILYNTVRAR